MANTSSATYGSAGPSSRTRKRTREEATTEIKVEPQEEEADASSQHHQDSSSQLPALREEPSAGNQGDVPSRTNRSDGKDTNLDSTKSRKKRIANIRASLRKKAFSAAPTSRRLFLPFYGQYDPTYFMMFSTTNNKKFEEHMKMNPFEGTPPNKDFIAFAIEVHNYLNPYRKKGVSPEQYRKMICNYFPSVVWERLWRRASCYSEGLRQACKSILFWYAQTEYSLEMRISDIERFERAPGFSKYLTFYINSKYQYHQTLGGVIMSRLYYASPFVKQTIMRDFYPEEFNEHGLLVNPSALSRERDKEISNDIGSLSFEPASRQGWERTDPMKPSITNRPCPHKYRRSSSSLSEKSQRKRVDKRAYLPENLRNGSYEDWRQGEGMKTTLKLWKLILNVPLRNFQSFRFSPNDPISHLTDAEIFYRRDHDLCDKCGNHELGKGNCIYHPFDSQGQL